MTGRISKSEISGQLVDIHRREIYPATVFVEDGLISGINRTVAAPEWFILPGLIDSHIHIESSMVTPGAFAIAAVPRGTTAVVSDPHEIANVLGVAGVRFMIDDSAKVPLKFFFGAPSCVPATVFETSGGVVDHSDVEELLKLQEVKYLSEMMNFPGVIYNDEEVRLKLEIAKRHNKPIDGHAPGLTGEMLKKYAQAGISTDHECSTIEEAREKISYGMKILIREGSAARNLDALKELFWTNPDMVMLCSDDLHPEMLQLRHINKLVSRLISEGYDKFDVIRSVTVNPAEHYKLNTGLLRKGDPADMIIADNLETMNILGTWINGQKVYGSEGVLFDYKPGKELNNFNCSPVREEDLRVLNRKGKVRVIRAVEGELLTGKFLHGTGEGRYVESEPAADILKIVVKDRYKDSPPAIGFINGFGLKDGAFAGSVAHDSHNIICVGTNDRDIAEAINEIIRLEGGLAVMHGGKAESFQLNIGGIMTTDSCAAVAGKYQALTETVRSCGCTMKAPFMTLSFMALLVIPELKIGDKGLFDVTGFQPVTLFD